MGFKYDSKEAIACLPAGDYEASLVSAVEGVSKSSGNPMLTVTWKVYSGSKETTLKDYISNPGTLFKLKRIAKALGKEQDFASNTFDLTQHLLSSVLLTLEVEEDDFGDKNTVKKYAPFSRAAAVAATAAKPHPSSNLPTPTADDIPF